MVLHAALALLVARLSGTGDVAIGTPVAGRGDQVLDPLVGMFVNTLVLRASVEIDQSFTDLLAHVSDVDLAAFGALDRPIRGGRRCPRPGAHRGLRAPCSDLLDA